MLVVGIMAVAAASVYGLASIASDWRKSSSETQKLLVLIKEIDSSTNITGSLAGIDKDNLTNISGGIVSSLGLLNVRSVGTDKLQFEYEDVNSRVCNDLSSKLLTGADNITMNINGTDIKSAEDVKNLGVACSQSRNDVKVIMEKSNRNLTITSSSPSTNVATAPPPNPAAPMNVPQPLIGNPWVASTAVPASYTLLTGAGQIPVVTPGTTPSVTQPPANPGTVLPPQFVPPTVTNPPPPTTPGSGGGTPGAVDPWACPVATCSAALYIEGEGGSNYFGVRMFATTPSIAANSWVSGTNSELTEEVTAAYIVGASAPSRYTKVNYKHDFNYEALRQAVYGKVLTEPLAAGIDAAANAMVGTLITDSAGVVYEIGTMEREMYASQAYSDPSLRGVIKFFFMRKM